MTVTKVFTTVLPAQKGGDEPASLFGVDRSMPDGEATARWRGDIVGRNFTKTCRDIPEVSSKPGDHGAFGAERVLDESAADG
jgi:hypothetical protein